MPSYSRRSRASLLAVSPLLIEQARRQLPEADVTAAADAAEAARQALALAVDGRVDAGDDRSGASSRVVAQERGLDRRVTGLREGLRGLGAAGLADADALGDALFPQGTAGLTRPMGRLQVPAYESFSRRLRAAAADPSGAWLAPTLGALADDLELWCVEVMVRAEAEAELGAAVRSAEAHREALVTAMSRLDLEVERATGGPRSAGYLAWADAARGVG